MYDNENQYAYHCTLCDGVHWSNHKRQFISIVCPKTQAGVTIDRIYGFGRKSIKRRTPLSVTEETGR